MAECVPADLSADLSARLEGYAWTRDETGASGTSVYRLHGKPGAPDLFLKHGQHAAADELAHEMLRLRWLAPCFPVPEVVQFIYSADAAWLLTTALGGETAYRAMLARPRHRRALVDALAACLRRLHALPIGACPFNGDAAHRLALARRRIDAGLVDTGDFDAEREGWTVEQVWAAAQAALPPGLERVVTHGDFSLDNLIVRDNQVVGCIDVGRLGIADPYQDLAILHNNLGEFDPSLGARLFGRYGIAAPDDDKLRFHLLLDELF